MMKEKLKTGPLPMGWHRVTWEQRLIGTDRWESHYMVSDSIVATILVHTALTVRDDIRTAKLSSWSDYPGSTITELEIK